MTDDLAVPDDALVGGMHFCALVNRAGRVDWPCLHRGSLAVILRGAMQAHLCNINRPGGPQVQSREDPA